MTFLIGVVGGTASGKTTVCKGIMKELGDRRVAILSLDSFYRPLTPEEIENVAEYNFDHPGKVFSLFLGHGRLLMCWYWKMLLIGNYWEILYK